jgi:hypothetical protein
MLSFFFFSRFQNCIPPFWSYVDDVKIIMLLMIYLRYYRYIIWNNYSAVYELLSRLKWSLLFLHGLIIIILWKLVDFFLPTMSCWFSLVLKSYNVGHNQVMFHKFWFTFLFSNCMIWQVEIFVDIKYDLDNRI